MSIRHCPRGGAVGECECPKPFDKGHVAAVLAAFADIDVKKGRYPSREAAREAIKRSPCRPTFIVSSGGGYQLVWVFESPVRDLARVERLLRAIAHFFNADPTTDCTRVLRLAGTVNHKHFYGSTGRTAKLL
jgi:hypothetical protein